MVSVPHKSKRRNMTIQNCATFLQQVRHRCGNVTKYVNAFARLEENKQQELCTFLSLLPEGDSLDQLLPSLLPSLTERKGEKRKWVSTEPPEPHRSVRTKSSNDDDEEEAKVVDPVCTRLPEEKAGGDHPKEKEEGVVAEETAEVVLAEENARGNHPEEKEEGVVAEETAGGCPVQVGMIPLKNRVLTGIANTVPMLLKIVTTEVPKDQKKERIPLNLAIVLDRSCSMEGPKLENSKKAVIKIIENLHPEDLVHFVCYGTKAVTIFSNKTCKNKTELTDMVKNVQTEGITNMSGGINTGSKLLNQYHKKGFSKRMFLFSDGLANKGMTGEGLTKIVRDIKNNDSIKVDSFGIGDDFDSNMMKEIAEFGSGCFFFIDSAEAIQQLVGKALDGLMELVGEDTVLKVRGSGPGIVKKIYGKDASTLVNGVNLGDLHENNTRTQLVELEVSPKDVGEFGVMTWELSFTFNNKKISLDGTVQLTATSDSKEVAKSEENPDVLVAVGLVESAESDERIQDFIKNGKKEEALAEQAAQIQSLESYAKIDRSDMMRNLVHNAQHTESLIRQEGCSKKSAQKIGHNAYSKRKGSVRLASHYA